MVRNMIPPFVLAPLLALAVVAPAAAMQGLTPEPYPSAPPGGAPLDPAPPGGDGGGQAIMKDPYPQVTQSNSQGNPPRMRRHAHQRLVPSSTQRKYGVDEAPR